MECRLVVEKHLELGGDIDMVKWLLLTCLQLIGCDYGDFIIIARTKLNKFLFAESMT